MNFSDKALARIYAQLENLTPWRDSYNVTELPHIPKTVMIPCKIANGVIRRMMMTESDRQCENQNREFNIILKDNRRLRRELRTALLDIKTLKDKLRDR